MARQTRLKREAPERNGPIRQVGMRTSAERPSHPADPAPTNGTVVDAGLKTARMVVDAADATVRGAVERGVETAYTVYEEYMRRGQIAAEHQNDVSNGRNGMTDYQRPGAWPPGTVLINPWLQLMQMWTTSLAAFMPGGAVLTNPWANPCAPDWGRPAQRSCAKFAVSFKLPHDLKAAIDVDLHPGAEFLQLQAGKLADGLTVDFEKANAGKVGVAVAVNEDLAAGEYTGEVKDNYGTVRGKLMVSITR